MIIGFSPPLSLPPPNIISENKEVYRGKKLTTITLSMGTHHYHFGICTSMLFPLCTYLDQAYIHLYFTKMCMCSFVSSCYVFCLVNLYIYFYFFFFFQSCYVACRILVPGLGIKPGPVAVKVLSLTTGLPGQSLLSKSLKFICNNV